MGPWWSLGLYYVNEGEGLLVCGAAKWSRSEGAQTRRSSVTKVMRPRSKARSDQEHRATVAPSAKPLEMPGNCGKSLVPWYPPLDQPRVLKHVETEAKERCYAA